MRARRLNRAELRCHSPWQLVRSFQLADGFPDPWPVFVARQFALASTTCGLTTLSSSSISSRCCRSRASGSCGPSWCDWRSVLSQGSLSCTCVWSVRAVRRRRRVVVGAMLETALVGRLGSGNLASWGFRTCPVRLAHPRNDPRKFYKIQVYTFQKYSTESIKREKPGQCIQSHKQAN